MQSEARAAANEKEGGPPEHMIDLHEIITDVSKEVGEVVEYAKDRNCKKEIKEAARALRTLMSQLQSNEAQALLRSLGKHTNQEDKAENAELREKIHSLEEEIKDLKTRDRPRLMESEEAKKVKTREFGVQTDRSGRPRTQKSGELVEVSTLEGCTTIEEWRAVAEKRWDPQLYCNSEITQGRDILATRNDVVTVIPIHKDSEAKENNRIWERFPELKDFQEEFVTIVRTTRLRSGEELESGKKVVKFIVKDYDEDLWNKVKRVREEMEEDNQEQVAFKQLPGITTAKFRKMLECIFHGSNTRAYLYVGKKQADMNPGAGKTREKPRNTYAMVVEGKNEEGYNEVFRQVKSRVKDTMAGSLIRTLRSTREGKLLITTEKDSTAMQKVREALDDLAGNLKFSKPGIRQQAIHIRGLDALTTKDEIVKAVEGKIGPLAGKNFKFSELRPNAGNTLAATLVLEDKDAKSLIECGPLRVGVVNCRVEKRLAITRCFKCWSYDHKAKDCDGTIDRSMLCFRCGKEGHKVKGCKEETLCPMCNERGHAADTSGCKIFRRALSRARKQAKQEEGTGTMAGQPTRGHETWQSDYGAGEPISSGVSNQSSQLSVI